MLPLAPGSNLAVVGPFAADPGLLFSDYAGFPEKGTQHKALPSCQPSIAEGIRAANVGGTTTSATRIPVASTPSSWNASAVAAALALVKGADATVLTLGISRSEEHEGIDRADTRLPPNQTAFAHAVFAAAAGKPVMLLLISGGMVSVDGLIDSAGAIVEAFNPGQQGPVALGQLLLGAENPVGEDATHRVR